MIGVDLEGLFRPEQFYDSVVQGSEELRVPDE